MLDLNQILYANIKLDIQNNFLEFFVNIVYFNIKFDTSKIFEIDQTLIENNYIIRSKQTDLFLITELFYQKYFNYNLSKAKIHLLE